MPEVTLHYPEMQGNSIADIQAENTCIGSRPYRVTSRNPLHISRGIDFNGLVGEIGANNTPNKRVGWHKYYMTKSAFRNLTKTHEVVLNCLLD